MTIESQYLKVIYCRLTKADRPTSCPLFMWRASGAGLGRVGGGYHGPAHPTDTQTGASALAGAWREHQAIRRHAFGGIDGTTVLTSAGTLSHPRFFYALYQTG